MQANIIQYTKDILLDAQPTVEGLRAARTQTAKIQSRIVTLYTSLYMLTRIALQVKAFARSFSL